MYNNIPKAIIKKKEVFGLNSKVIAIAVILLAATILTVVALLVIISFFVQIPAEWQCINQCTSRGYDSGFCQRVATTPAAIEQVEKANNAEHLPGASCILNPWAMGELGSETMCFCKKSK
ncbi:MAG: hypothetical protein J7K68_00175 [Candidatus Diapherotrites archaeon]|nr:hypothetical protein [Candidatus Diapherotrites archaeon]